MKNKNVTREDVYGIEKYIAELKKKRDAVVNDKLELGKEIVRLNEQLAESPGLAGLNKRIGWKRKEIIQKIADMDRQLREMKSEIHAKCVERDHMKHLVLDAEGVQRWDDRSPSLSVLRQKYVDFASDLTRVSSMRTMAAQFVRELDFIMQNR